MKRALVAVSLALASVSVEAQPVVDAAREFVRGLVVYAPASVFDVRVDHTGATPGGSYVALTAVRTIPGDENSDQVGLLVDLGTRTVTAGLVVPIPPTSPPLSWETLPRFAQEGLAAWLSENMGTRIRVRWPAVPSRPAAVVQLTAEMSTGYGWSGLPVAISADGRYFAMGGSWPLDRDVREARRELLRGPEIQWDPGHEDAVIQVVEFSDFQCPACKRAWENTKPVLASFGTKVRHGLVNFPLVRSHPWAFRAAVAGACIARLWPQQLLAFKEELYRLQDSLTVASVDEAALGFLTQRSLDEEKFRTCYLKDPAVDTVLRQLNLGQRLGVLGTPAYYANGEALPYGRKDWTEQRLQAILEAGGLPEGAAEIPYTPPTPAPASGASK